MMRKGSISRGLWLRMLVLLPFVAACSSGGGDASSPPPPPSNTAPTSNAGAPQTVTEGSTVTLNGSASSDPDQGDVLTYSWTQTAGQAVTINNATAQVANFVAPNVQPGVPEVLTFQLEVNDGTVSNSNTNTNTVDITVQEPQPAVTVSGKVNYEFVPPNLDCRGLNFLGTVVRPIRGATVQLIDVTSGLVIAATTADDVGDYSFANVPGATAVRLRVRAELKRTGAPSWDVEVRDNTDAASGALPNRALYVVDGGDFNTGGTDVTRDLTATTGWGATSYTGPRAAAPFAILDAIYSGMQLVLTADPLATFGPLDAFWSVNNTLVSGPSDIDNGELPASFYTSNPDGGAPNPSLFLLGDANTDTEEFDDHVVVHEWGHYFEDNFSRSDSIGGPHALGQTLDARLAFGEGWATALAAMALDNPLYCDTGAAGSTQGFGINAESSSFGLQGWYNEISVTTFLYDLYDTNDDGSDNGSIGFQPIFDTMVGPQATTEAFTSVFSFAAELLPMLNAADQALVNSQLTRESINPVGIDIWGGTETNDAGGNLDALPLYTDLVADGSTVNVCTNADFDGTNRTGNKLAQDRYIRLSVPTTRTYNVTVTTVNPPAPTPDPDDRDQSDPDIFVYRDGTLVAVGNGGDANSEVFTTQSTLLAGETYAVYVEEFRYDDADPDNGTPDSYPNRICFDVSFAP